MTKKLAALVLSLCIHAAHAATVTTDSTNPALNVRVETKDVDLTLEGRIREEFCYFDRIAALRDNHNDSFQFYRHKATFGAYGEYGNRTHGQPAVTGRVKFCSYNYWDKPTQYAKLSEETIKINSGQVNKEIDIGSEHTHYGSTPHVYLKQGWVNINFDILSPQVNIPLSLKVGYFRYKVGRGVSLGDYHEGSISFMGWQERTCESNADQSPPGVLFISELSESAQVEFYYSKWRSNTSCPQDTHEPIRVPRLDVSAADSDPGAIERGTKSDRDLFSARLLFDGASRSGMRWHMEPYAVYVSAPEQRIEIQADASTTLGTYGIMMEAQSPWISLNAEVAMQSGRQIVHGIDRNKQELELGSDGKMGVVYTHLLQNDYSSKQLVTDIVNSHARRQINRSDNIEAFAPLRDQHGTTVENVVTSTYPFLAKHRFRKEYRLALHGYMAMLDARIKLFEGMYLNAAGAIVSGDDYPYNGEVNKTYNGFLPLRDQNYYGGYVHSNAVLHARKFPRPTNMADHKLYAFNHDEDCSNLRYIGLGLQWHPLNDPQKLTIVPCTFFFWQDVSPFKWDKTATRASFGNAAYDAVYSACLTKLGISGAQTTERARSHLGNEASLSVFWNPAPSCQLSIAGSVFFPGQLYRDVDGMPNRNARRQRADGTMVYESLGSATMFGFNTRLSFVF